MKETNTSSLRFSETLWFKKGAEQSTRFEEARDLQRKGERIDLRDFDVCSYDLPIEDRYIDDGNRVSPDDRVAYSLRGQR